MSTFTIKITGSGTIPELHTALQSMLFDIQNLQDQPIPNLDKMGKIELELEFDTLKCEVSQD
jgi:hypothetical protein